jgi:hypothetical protein
MDPASALSGEPRQKGATTASAPAAAQWLQNPTQHDDSPEPGSPDWWRAFLRRAGRAMDEEDAIKWQENKPCNPTKS